MSTNVSADLLSSETDRCSTNPRMFGLEAPLGSNMRGDDQYIIDCSPSFFARQWALVVESGGQRDRLTVCLELALQTLITLAMAEGLIHFDWPQLRAAIEADVSAHNATRKTKGGLVLGAYWDVYYCLMKHLRKVPKNERFFTRHNAWFWKDGKEKSLSEDARRLKEDAIRLRNSVQGHVPRNRAPVRSAAMEGDYRYKVTSLVRSLAEWWQH